MTPEVVPLSRRPTSLTQKDCESEILRRFVRADSQIDRDPTGGRRCAHSPVWLPDCLDGVTVCRLPLSEPVREEMRPCQDDLLQLGPECNNQPERENKQYEPEAPQVSIER